MKRNFKIIVSLFLLLAFGLSGISFQKVEAGTVTRNKYENSVQLAKNLIQLRMKVDNHCTWNLSTKLSDIVNTYDLDGNVNGYIFNLKTNNKDSGYIVVDYSGNNPYISQFGYDYKYYLQYSSHFSSLQKKRIINLGDYNYYYLDNNNIKDVYTNKVIKNSTQLKEQYRKHRNSIAVRSLSDQSQLEPSDNYTIPSLYGPYSNWPLTMDDFSSLSIIDPSVGWCCPTACTNMLMYWQHRGYNLIDKNAQQTFKKICPLVGYPNNTNAVSAKNGLWNYCFLDITTSIPAGSDYQRKPSLSWVKTNLKNGNMLYISILTSSYVANSSGGHALLGIGYSGEYIQVIDEWTRSFNNYYYYNDGNGLNTGISYVRWK